MDNELTELRRIAEAATRGPWTWSAPAEDDGWGDRGPNLETVERGPLYDDGSQGAAETIVGSWGHDANGITVEDANAKHIATFDPPTVLALIDRLEAPTDTQEAVRRLKESGVGAYMILAAVTKVYNMETKGENR